MAKRGSIPQYLQGRLAIWVAAQAVQTPVVYIELLVLRVDVSFHIAWTRARSGTSFLLGALSSGIMLSK